MGQRELRTQQQQPQQLELGKAKTKQFERGKKAENKKSETPKMCKTNCHASLGRPKIMRKDNMHNITSGQNVAQMSKHFKKFGKL